MDETKTSQGIVLQAIERAQAVLAAYIEPGPRDDQKALGQLLAILDDEALIAACSRLRQ